jgi:hypothetical protein
MLKKSFTLLKMSCPFCLHESLRADKCTNCGAALDEEVSEEKGVLYIPYWMELTIDFSELNREIFPQVFALVKEYWKKAEEYTILSLYPSQLHQFDRENYIIELVALDYVIEAIKNFLKHRLGVDVPLIFSSTKLDDETAKVRLSQKDYLSK